MGAWLELSSECEELSLPQPQGQQEDELYTPLSPESYRCFDSDCNSKEVRIVKQRKTFIEDKYLQFQLSLLFVIVQIILAVLP